MSLGRYIVISEYSLTPRTFFRLSSARRWCESRRVGLVPSKVYQRVWWGLRWRWLPGQRPDTLILKYWGRGRWTPGDWASSMGKTVEVAQEVLDRSLNDRFQAMWRAEVEDFFKKHEG